MSSVTLAGAPAPVRSSGSLRRLSFAGARASWTGAVGTGLVIAAASTLSTVTGVLIESGMREPAGSGDELVTLAGSVAGTALFLVVFVVASTTTLALRRRRREFALLRAVGATRAQVRRMITFELLLLSAIAAPLGAGPGLLLARWLDPVLRQAGVVGPDFTSSLSPLPAVSSVLLLVPTVLLAGRLAARETLRVAPTAAIADSAAETKPIGRVRLGAAAVTALGGLSVALTPLWVPGTAGAAAAASSQLLLISAAALAGPVLVAWTFRRAAQAVPGRAGAATRLAVQNLGGFSRRLTTVVVPLALLLGTGTIQSTIEQTIQRAATEQLTAAIGTDHVASSPTGLDPAQLAALADTPGVTEVVPLADAPARMRIDDEEEGVPDSLSWGSTVLRAVPPLVAPDLFDPAVTQGSLEDLQGDDTVAISADTASLTGRGRGDTLDIRLDGSAEAEKFEVVAVYDRGLGIGPVLVGPQTLTAHGVTPVVNLALVASDETATPALSGTSLTTTERYVAAAGSPDADVQRLSTLLTLFLLLFVGIGSLNALGLLTAGRVSELRLLYRSGATARQLRAMTAVEAALTGLAAWAVGTAAVLPAVVGVSAGLLGFGLPAADLGTYAVLSGVVVGLPLLVTQLIGVRVVSAATRVER
jgi:putative ABC transport system permease protein